MGSDRQAGQRIAAGHELGRVPWEIKVQANPLPADVGRSRPVSMLRRVLGAMSLFNLFMTIPQVVTIWIGRQAAGCHCYRGVPISSLPFSGSGLGFRSTTRTFICPAWAGSSWMVR
jgi:hypothetical protein